jgi:tripartite-type tricarboxylate transporter receptor subunit TctC
LAQAPHIPTFNEMGLPSVSYSTWLAVFAPKNVPKEIIGKLNAAAVEARCKRSSLSDAADHDIAELESAIALQAREPLLHDSTSC